MKSKLKCVVVDDDKFALQVVIDFLESSQTTELTGCYTNPMEFLRDVPDLNYDIALLDIMLPEINGFEIAKAIGEKPVIFISGYEKKLSEATKLKAIDVISKPYSKDRLFFGLEKARKCIMDKSEGSAEYDLFNVEGAAGLMSIKINDFIFASADENERRHKNVILKNGKKIKLLYCTFERLLDHSTDLIRINKSELVSRSAIELIDRDLLTLSILSESKMPKQVTLSRIYRNNIGGLDKKRK